MKPEYIMKLVYRKPPGLLSAVSASIVCKESTKWPLKALREKKRGEREK